MSGTPVVGGEDRWTAQRVVFFALTVAGVAGCLLLVAGFAPAIVWAVALAVALHKPYVWLLGRIKRPGVAAAVGVLLVMLLLLAPVAVLLQSLGSQVFAVASVLRSGAAQDWALGTIAKYPWLDKMLDRAVGLVNLKESSQAAAGFFAGKVQAVLAGSVRMVTQMAIMLFTLFFLFKDGRVARRAFVSLLPLTAARAEFLVTRMEETISASLQGSLTIAAIQGCLGGVMFWALGVPSALLWAFVMGLLAMIPSLGTFLIWMPVAAFLALSGHAVKAVILVAWGGRGDRDGG